MSQKKVTHHVGILKEFVYYMYYNVLLYKTLYDCKNYTTQNINMWQNWSIHFCTVFKLLAGSWNFHRTKKWYEKCIQNQFNALKAEGLDQIRGTVCKIEMDPQKFANWAIL